MRKLYLLSLIPCLSVIGCSGNDYPSTIDPGSGSSAGNDPASCYPMFIGMDKFDFDASSIESFFNGGGADKKDSGVDSSVADSSVVDSSADASDSSVVIVDAGVDSSVVDSGVIINSDAGSCNVACDPGCKNFTTTPNNSGSNGYTFIGGGASLTAAPSGWAKQLYTPCDPASQKGCEFDSYCNSSGVCALYSPGQKNSSVGVDLTAESACYNTDGSATFPLCNRGNKDATSGSINVGFDQNPSPSVCSPVPSPYPGKGYCVVDFSKSPLRAGSCIDLNPTTMQNLVSCSGVNISGNRDWFPNYDGKFAESNLCNNEGYLKSGQTCSTLYEPQTFPSQTYTPSCPSGLISKWKSLSYASTVSTSGGTSSQVIFSAKFATIGSDGGLGAWGNSITLTDVPITSPMLCPLTGPSPCPIDLSTLNNAGENSALSLTITLIPSADGIASSSVSGYQVLYDCVSAL